MANLLAQHGLDGLDLGGAARAARSTDGGRSGASCRAPGRIASASATHAALAHRPSRIVGSLRHHPAGRPQRRPIGDHLTSSPSVRDLLPVT